MRAKQTKLRFQDVRRGVVGYTVFQNLKLMRVEFRTIPYRSKTHGNWCVEVHYGSNGFKFMTEETLVSLGIPCQRDYEDLLLHQVSSARTFRKLKHAKQWKQHSFRMLGRRKIARRPRHLSIGSQAMFSPVRSL